jgi:mycothiol system anti-sigma-R factor
MTTPESREDACSGHEAQCEEALVALEQYLDGELENESLSGIRAHLAHCYPCADRASFEEQLRAIVRTRCAEHAPDSLRDRIRERLDGMVANG